jgi:DNA polymerase sigma
MNKNYSIDEPDFIPFQNDSTNKCDNPLFQSTSSELITPWVKNSKKINNFDLRLHNEIIEFFEYIRPKSEEIAVRSKIIEEFIEYINVTHNT